MQSVGSQLAGRNGRPSHRSRARMLAIAALPREGKIQRAIRRAFIASDGQPLRPRDLVRFAYPELEQFRSWHFWSIRRAAPRYAIKDGRYWRPIP